MLSDTACDCWMRIVATRKEAEAEARIYHGGGDVPLVFPAHCPAKELSEVSARIDDWLARIHEYEADPKAYMQRAMEGA